MDELLTQSVGLVVAIFLVTAMLSLGLAMTVQQIGHALDNKLLVLKALLVGFLLVPVIAIALTQVIPMEKALATGLILYALAGGTEGGPKFVQIVGGNTPFASALLAVLLTGTVILLPMVINVAIPDANVSMGTVVAKLLLLVALPISVGMLINTWSTDLAGRVAPVFHRLSMILLAVAFTLIIYVNLEAIMSLQGTALLAGLLLFALAYGLGYAAGGPALADRKALAIMTFARNGSLSIMIADQVFSDQPQVLVMVTLMSAASVVGAVIVVLVDRFLNRQSSVTTTN